MTRAITLVTRILGAAVLASLAMPALAARSEVTVDDTMVYPESISALPDGTVILGSFVHPVIYRAGPHDSKAEAWIHLTGGQNLSVLGVLAQPRTKTLWACIIQDAPAAAASAMTAAGAPPPAPARVSSLRAFDLSTGAPKSSYPLPGATNFCNDITIARDGALYVSDTPNGRVLRLKPGADALELWAEDPALKGIDGLTFLGPTLYVNTVTTNHLYRIPIGADGKAGAPVDIALSQPLMGPDGMRSARGRLFVAENRAGRVSQITIKGDAATITVIKDGFITPTAVSPIGNTLWVGEAKFAYRNDPKLKGQDPGPFKAYALPMPQ
jgi:hypothetical protein